MDAKNSETFRLRAATVGEKSAAVVLLNLADDGKINIFTTGDPVLLAGLMRIGESYLHQSQALQLFPPQVTIPKAVEDVKAPAPELVPIDNQLELPLPESLPAKDNLAGIADRKGKPRK